MPRRLLIALVLLVAAPIVLLGWVSSSMVNANQRAAQQNLSKLLSTQLYDTDRQIQLMFERYAATLGRELETSPSLIPTLKRMRREAPIVRQGIFVDPNGLILFPQPTDSPDIDAVEVAATLPAMVDARPLPAFFSEQSQTAFASDSTDQQIDFGQYKQAVQSPLNQRGNSQALPSQNARRSVNADRPVFLEPKSWQQWFMGDGAQVVFWRFRTDGSSVGILLERSRWLSDLIALLPDQTDETPPIAPRVSIAATAYATLRSGKAVTYNPTPLGGISLIDESKREVYRWGKEVGASRPVSTVELSQPLASWQLKLRVDEPLVAGGTTVPLYLSLGGMGALLLSLGAYVLTSVRRQIENARSRVSFAGQVSHELRTPLTNIRLYTELAESDLEKVGSCDAKNSLSNRLEVIDHESRRLQRLVSGVLEMIRPTGKKAGVRCEETDLCELISVITQQFQPSFEAASLSIEASCHCETALEIDPDVVEMVLVNLLGNVEKYVPAGGTCRVLCELQEPDVSRIRASSSRPTLRILVEDDGPGIRGIHRARVFRPFVRLDDSISAPSGTGIGLTIARRAARRHGGDLKLLADCERGGSAFELTIPVGKDH